MKQCVESALTTIPADMRLLVGVGLCLHRDAELQHFESRVAWLAEQLKISTRSVTRHMDQALMVLAAELWKGAAAPSGRAAADDGWYVAKLSTVLLLDRGRPEALETRTIVATRSDLSEIMTSVSVPRHKLDNAIEHGLEVDILFGGTIKVQEQPYESLFRQVIVLPRPLRAGDEHEYMIRRMLPPGQLLAPHYVQVPLRRRVDRFELRVRFTKENSPQKVWKLTGVPPSVVYDIEPASEVLELSPAGEVYAEFEALEQGHGYGLCWRCGP